MAAIGLFRGPALRSAAAALSGKTAFYQSTQRIAAPAVLYGAKRFVRTDVERLYVQEFGLLCKNIPDPWKPSDLVPTRDSFSRIKKYVTERLLDVFSLLTLKYYLDGWKKKPFAADAEELYNLMNEAYAQGNTKYLETVCAPSMIGTLKNEIKSRKYDFEWRKESTLTPARIVQIRCGRIAGNYTVGQVVVRMDQEQTVSAIARGARSQIKRGDAKTTHVREYVVFQRTVTDPNEPWFIYGKIPVPSWDKTQ
ncbi:hypothetical protein IWW40_001509 [Coemansia sp. RSA 1250]|nr:hypothetical protein IWW40_001509 [Coemansia sp. RSA 1250]